MIDTFIIKHELPHAFSKTAEDYFIPLAKKINLDQEKAKKTYFVGINGSQGSGKSTLAAFLKDYLVETYAMKVVVMSLDDFYYSRSERQKIAKQVHPLFATRGVPTTHNMHQAKTVLENLKNNQPTTIPRFNKATDNPHAISACTKISTAVDVVILEGWCWGVGAQTTEQLKQPVNTLEAVEDPNAEWRNHVNQQLLKHYTPLYSFMDKWVMLQSPSFADVYAWRLEQEHKLGACSASVIGNADKSGIMNEQQLQRFIQHYQRLTEHALNTLPEHCDHVFELNFSRAITLHKTKKTHI